MAKINQMFKIQKQDENLKVSLLGQVLHQIVMAEGVEVYRDLKKLEELLQQHNIEPASIRRLQLVLETSNFLRYTDQLKNGISAIDINNMIQSSKRESGLTVDTIRRAISDLLYGAGIPQTIKADDYIEDVNNELINGNIYITPYAYEKELDIIEGRILVKGTLEGEEYSYLNYCSLAGIPRASRILGELYLMGDYVEEDLQKAEEYLRLAASLGDEKSNMLLADYSYEMAKYNEAFELYTRTGEAINGQRKGRIKNLYDIKQYNKKELVLWGAISIILEILILSACGMPVVTVTHSIMRVLCTLLNIGACIVIFLKAKREKFADFREYGLLYAIIAFLYFFVYILI